LNLLRRNDIEYHFRNRPLLIAPLHRTDRYRKSFIPSCVKIWNHLPVDLCASASINSFKSNYKNTSFRSKTSSYSIGERRLNILHTRFRLGFTTLRRDLHTRNIIPSELCHCLSDSESYIHYYFLKCPSYQTHRTKLLNDLALLIPLLPIDNILVEILILGFDPPRDNLNSQLFTTVQKFINNTNRFPSSSLLC
jgi:hypothetical protein